MLLAKILSVCYIILGLLGLWVMSFQESREDPRFKISLLGSRLTLVHGLLQSVCAIFCGFSVWLFPALAPYFAWGVFALLLFGQIVSLSLGRGIRCPRCLATAVPLTSIAACAISLAIR